MTDNYVLDCSFDTGDGMWCFCPIEMDADGNVTSIITGLNFLSDSPPKGGHFVGVVHQDGQEACDEWCEKNRAVVDRLLAEREAA